MQEDVDCDICGKVEASDSEKKTSLKIEVDPK